MIACEVSAKVFGVQDVQAHRRTRLRAWLDDQGGQAKVIKKFQLTPSDASYLSQVLNGYSFGEKAARRFEHKLRMTPNYLDQLEAREPPAQFLVAHSMSPAPFDDPPELIWEDVMKLVDALPAQFICAVPDDALSPDTVRGTRFIFAANAKPTPGAAVIVSDRDGYLYMRRFVQGVGDNWTAEARNNAYASLDGERDGVRLLAVALWRNDGQA